MPKANAVEIENVEVEVESEAEEGRITCQLCGALVHSIRIHLDESHDDYSLDDYKAEFPAAPVLSNSMKERILAKRAEKTQLASVEPAEKASVLHLVTEDATEEMVPMNIAFGLGKSAKGAFKADKTPILIKRFARPKTKIAAFIPDVDAGFVYDIEILKNILLGLNLNLPILLWGHAGTGKSSFIEQVAAVINQPLMRVQHTINTEESHIVGQWTVKNGATEFSLGPLARAMRDGYIYMADEYDFAMPSVLSVYQSVLEGKALVIKEADEENMTIRPHPNFRFVATGNTNGSGDDTGLYQGTNMQNSANYDRFGITCRVNYMNKKMESMAVANKSGAGKEIADLMVEYGTLVRDAYDAGKISSTVSPRALINAATVGLYRGDFKVGINLAFGNKLNKVDREICDGFAQRVFG